MPAMAADLPTSQPWPGPKARVFQPLIVLRQRKCSGQWFPACFRRGQRKFQRLTPRSITQPILQLWRWHVRTDRKHVTHLESPASGPAAGNPMLDAGTCSRGDLQGPIGGCIGTFKGIAVKTQGCRCDLQGQTGCLGTTDLQRGIDAIIPIGTVPEGPCGEQGILGVGLFQQPHRVRRLDHLEPGSGEG